MKKTTSAAVLAIAISGLMACASHKPSGSSDSTTTITTDSSKTMVKTDSSKAALPDTAFANKAAIGGMAEVALGKMASSKSMSPQIKQFGTMMIMDHGKANAELMNIAKSKNITLPTTLDAEHQAKSDSLSKLTGKAFDMAYVNAMIDGHKKTLALMQTEASSGTDPDLKAFAAKTTPVVQSHLDAIMKIQQSLK